MKLFLKNEWLNILVAISPFLYLALIWQGLPDIIPTHWNAAGEIDDYGSKYMLVLLGFMLPVLTYMIFTLVPYLKSWGWQPSSVIKYNKFKFIITVLMSALAIYIMYITYHQSRFTLRIFTIIGLIFTIIGNYLPTIKRNKLIGIRTPWTLSDDRNWMKTHQFSGPLWVIGGISILLISLMENELENVHIFILIIIFTIAILPFLYSYYIFKTHNKTHI